MLLPVIQHPWDLSPREAIQLQRELAGRFRAGEELGEVNLVAGLDVGIRHDKARAAAVVLALPGLQIVEQAAVERPVTFPYVPGLLSFRELPALLEALARLHTVPDVLMLDGQGYAHPRRMGIATHLGIVLDHPTVGCAKSRLCGHYEEPGRERSSLAWLTEEDETIGAVVRTRSGVKPVFVSMGHRVPLNSAIELVLRCCSHYRLPEPTRQAHHLASGS